MKKKQNKTKKKKKKKKRKEEEKMCSLIKNSLKWDPNFRWKENNSHWI